MHKRVFINQGLETWSATINTAGGIMSNDKGIAFVRKGGGKWRCIEWFIVPSEIKEQLFSKVA